MGGKRIKICKDKSCHNSQTTQGYCRLHYLRNWKLLKSKKKLDAAKKLNRYVEHMCKTYPNRYMEQIKKDLNSPNFERFIEEEFGTEGSYDNVFNGLTYEEEIEHLIHDLKIEDEF